MRRLALLLAMLAAPAMAQTVNLGGGPSVAVAPDKPVTFLADQVQYDQTRALVTATGHVQAWQNDHVLMADRIVYDRTTNVAAATGNVVLMSPDGQVLFSDYAELGEGLREGVLSGMSARLPENGRLIANGARRTEGKLNELSRAVYSTCDLCASDPTHAPLWQIRARRAVQDLEHKKIEYQDAVLEMYGVPVAWFPYIWHVDPSVKRASGFLIPALGNSSRLGTFFAQPYFWAIDEQQDATITPLVTTRDGTQISLQYRRRFNEGLLNIDTSAAATGGKAQGSLFASGRFSFDDTWRYGFDINRASNRDYLRDFHISGQADVLASQVYVEGFGQGAYSRLDTRFYQGLVDSVTDSKLPVVLPRYTYSYFGKPDALGGRLSLTAGGFNVLRSEGTSTERAALSVNWQRPFTGQLGDLWKLTFQADAAAYTARDLSQQPNFSAVNSATIARGLPQAALQVRWPLLRDGGAWGQQVIEPIAQVIVAPGTPNHDNSRIPNEDSLDQEFTDANLFALNRYPGIDRLEGGVRGAVALHGAWYLGGTVLDGLVGQSYRTQTDSAFVAGSGLAGTVSDVVGRVSFAPTPWLDLTYRTRLDHKSFNIRMADALASVGTDRIRVTGGYLYTTNNPYTAYDQSSTNTAAVNTPRNEITLGASASAGYWRVRGSVRRDLQSGQFVTVGVGATYEDECFIFDASFNRRYTTVNGENGASLLLFQVTFKTVGQFGYKAL